MGILDRLKKSWNAFIGLDPPGQEYVRHDHYTYLSSATSYRPDRLVMRRGSEKTIAGAIFNRIAIDCAELEIKHVRIDDQNRYSEDIDSGLNTCITLEANKDQTAKQLIRDIIISMFDEGCVAVVPIDTSDNILKNNSFDIYSLRVGKITQWYPDEVMVECYDDNTGLMKDLRLPKSKIAIIENPLSAIMNEPNSTLQRLIRKISLLDIVDERIGSGKLDLIIQLPYIIKTQARQQQAENRRADIEKQLGESKYGIAYTDGTEHITQLNRPIENNLFKQVEYYTNMFLSQLGVTDGILNGSADEKTMLNYLRRTVMPAMDAIVDEFNRKFITRTARSQGQRIMYFSNLFNLITVDKLAEIADKFTRNEIMTSNEIRHYMGLKPSTNPSADELRNKNLPQESTELVEKQEPDNAQISADTKIGDLT